MYCPLALSELKVFIFGPACVKKLDKNFLFVLDSILGFVVLEIEELLLGS